MLIRKHQTRWMRALDCEVIWRDLGYVRLWGVERPWAVPDVLSRVEHSEGETGQEVSRGQETGHGAECEASTVWSTKYRRIEEVQNLFNLNDMEYNIRIVWIVKSVQSELHSKYSCSPLDISVVRGEVGHGYHRLFLRLFCPHLSLTTRFLKSL